jgi:hypothetical protein
MCQRCFSLARSREGTPSASVGKSLFAPALILSSYVSESSLPLRRRLQTSAKAAEEIKGIETQSARTLRCGHDRPRRGGRWAVDCAGGASVVRAFLVLYSMACSHCIGDLGEFVRERQVPMRVLCLGLGSPGNNTNARMQLSLLLRLAALLHIVSWLEDWFTRPPTSSYRTMQTSRFMILYWIAQITHYCTI